MANVTAKVDAVDAMKGITVTIRYRRFAEWQFRTWFGLFLVRLGLRVTGATVVVEIEDGDVE